MFLVCRGRLSSVLGAPATQEGHQVLVLLLTVAH